MKTKRDHGTLGENAIPFIFYLLDSIYIL